MWRVYSIQNVMFILHRLTGLVLLGYLVAHILAVSTALLAGGTAFTSVMKKLAGPGFMALDIALFGCVLFHAFNGLRLIMNERGWLPERSDGYAGPVAATTVAVWLCAGAVAILG
ncbi:MAG: hypothetical protein K2Y16_07885 [Burkholderiales bacterium]|nr:hypothetical protein [Burkholderiales bacterium]